MMNIRSIFCHHLLPSRIRVSISHPCSSKENFDTVSGYSWFNEPVVDQIELRKE
jgi:hypothetical protein